MFDVIFETKTGPEAVTDIFVDTKERAIKEAKRVVKWYSVLEVIEYKIENGVWVRA